MESVAVTGYQIFKSVFTPGQITEMRSLAKMLLPPNSPPFSSSSVSNVFDACPALAKLVFGNQKLKRLIESVHGEDFVLIDEFALHDSIFGGWHTDTTSAEARGRTFHLVEDFGLCQWALYLQDNDSTYGGGLSAIPGSHLASDPYVGPYMRDAASIARSPRRVVRKALQVWSRYAGHTDQEGNSYGLASQKGDVVAFDLRTIHRATPYRKAPVLDDQRKIALFFVVGRNNEAAREYTKWIQGYHPDKAEGTRKPSNQFLTLMGVLGIKFGV